MKMKRKRKVFHPQRARLQHQHLPHLQHPFLFAKLHREKGV
jgi:hypothetical protein